MRRLVPAMLGFLLLASHLPADPIPAQSAAGHVTFGPADWPWWRGPQRNGIAADQNLPIKWGANENVVWNTAVPGRGHGSPTVVGDQVFLATAEPDRQTQSVLCYQRSTGKR